MKHLCGCLNDNLFLGLLFNLLNHSNYLIAGCEHESFFGDILVQQNVEILIAASQMVWHIRWCFEAVHQYVHVELTL
jgi:hypothetical protein